MFTAIAAWMHGRKFAVLGVISAIALAWHEYDKRQFASRKVNKVKRRFEDAQREANDAARKQVETIKEETNERVQRADEARNSVPADAGYDSLSDASKRRYF